MSFSELDIMNPVVEQGYLIAVCEIFSGYLADPINMDLLGKPSTSKRDCHTGHLSNRSNTVIQFRFCCQSPLTIDILCSLRDIRKCLVAYSVGELQILSDLVPHKLKAEACQLDISHLQYSFHMIPPSRLGPYPLVPRRRGFSSRPSCGL